MEVVVPELFTGTFFILWTFCLSQSVTTCPCPCREPVYCIEEPIPVKWLLNDGSVKNLQGENTRKPGDDTLNYRNLVFSNDMNEIYAGTREKLLIISASDLTVRKTVDFPAAECRSKETCHYVRLIQPLENDRLYVCHTAPNAGCCFAWTNGTVNEESCTAVSEAPKSTAQNISVTYLQEEQRLFIGVGAQNMHGSSRFWFDSLNGSRIDVPEEVISEDTGTKWLNIPDFVGNPIEYGEYVYFFFREYSSEAVNGGRIIYSRVGRVCKNDIGGDKFTDLQKKFTTYQKARLDCSIKCSSIEYPEVANEAENSRTYEYNELQGIYRLNETIFAVFTNPRTSEDSSSAVCAYNIDEIVQLFDGGQVLGQADDKNLWESRNRISDVFTCTTKAPSSTYDFLRSYPLMQPQVPNRRNYRQVAKAPNYVDASDAPLLILDHVRLSQIVVDNMDVMFLGTERGTVIKANLTEDNCTAEWEVDFNIEGLPEAPVLSMLRNSDGNVAYIGTANSVYMLPLDFKMPAPSCTNITVIQRSSIPYGQTTTEDLINIYIPSSRTANLNFATYASEKCGLQASNVMCNKCVISSEEHIFSTYNGKKFATVNAVISKVMSNCICTVDFTTHMANVQLVANITQITDEVIENKECRLESQTYNDEIIKYKFNLTIWKNKQIQTYCNNNTCTYPYCSDGYRGITCA